MNQITKPMLAGKCGPLTGVSYPVLATPKLDGIRCLKINGRAVTRTFKPIPNEHVRTWIEANLPYGVDGEIIVRGATFSDITGHVARRDGRPDFTFAIFDYVKNELAEPYVARVLNLLELEIGKEHVEKIIPQVVNNAAELQAFEERVIAAGYEGAMIRSPQSPYKCGRSTTNEGYLLKIKRFEDAEAIILECIEEQANDNPAERDAFGRTKRSSSQSGKRGKGTLGALRVRMCQSGSDNGIEFTIGSGFDTKTRAAIWQRRDSMPGRVVKFKHQPSGAKSAPRFPIFLGFRERWDMEVAA